MVWNTILDYLSMAGAFIFMVFFFGSCVFVHELGHFLAAKWRGLHIDAFSIGFKKIWGKKINGIEYRIGWLPLGGYVELPQVDSAQEEIKAADGTVLPQAKPFDRLVTAFAGPFFNIIYGLLLGCLVWWIGIPQDSPKMREIAVASVVENSPEYTAGLRKGDKIVRINGRKFRMTWAEFAKEILLSIGEVELEVERNGKLQTVRYTPKVNPNAPGNLKYEKIAWPFFEPDIPIELYPEKGSEAEKGGIMRGDLLVSVNGLKFTDYSDFFQFITYCGAEKLIFEVKRENKIVKCEVIPFEIKNNSPEKRYLLGFNYVPQMPMTVGKLNPYMPAAKAGLRSGDIIEKWNNIAVDSIEKYMELSKANKGTEVILGIKRGNEFMEIAVVPQEMRLFTIGLAIGLKDYPDPIQQFYATLDMSFKSLRGLLTTVGNMVGLTEETSSIQLRHMSGPAGIADTLFNAVHQSSIMTGIYFVVVICFALAIFNLMPLPVLDGGHIVFALIEIIFRKPVPKCIVAVLSYIFIGLLVLLMLYVSFFDLLRLAPSSLRDKFEKTEQIEK